MLITSEYTRLYSSDGDVEIKPFTEFEPFEGHFVVGSYARIKNTETDEIITLHPGQQITSVGTVTDKSNKEISNEYTDEINKSIEEILDNKLLNEINESVSKPKPRRKRKVKDDN